MVWVLKIREKQQQVFEERHGGKITKGHVARFLLNVSYVDKSQKDRS